MDTFYSFIDITMNMFYSSIVIVMNTFDSLKNLIELRLNFNKINKIQNGLFKSLNKLEILWLHQNTLFEINQNNFESLTSLTLLSLYSNKITKISNDLFIDSNRLQSLYLHGNEIELIEIFFLVLVISPNFQNLFYINYYL